MFAPIADIRPGERRFTWGAALTLLVIVAGHVILETSRDALFLARLPAQRLPWMYLGIAAIALAIFYLEHLRNRVSVSPRALAAWLFSAGTVTAVLWLLVDPGRPGLYYTLYIWSGLVSTLIVSRFWILVGGSLSISQAKRLFPVVLLGGVVGAVLGSIVARSLAGAIGPQGLLAAAAGFLGAAGFLPPVMIGRAPASAGTASPIPATPVPLGRTLARVHTDPYLRRVGALLILSTVTFTLVDYLFKAVVAREVPPDRLGSFFAQAYLVFNLLSLAAQLLLVRYLVVLVRQMKIDQFLSLLPVLMLALAGAFFTGLTMVAAYALKGLDGTFRYSLHRTASEMLLVPIGSSSRGAIKGLLDVVGQRGGQTVASLLILGATMAAPTLTIVAGLVALAGLAWTAVARSIRPHYLDLFRRALTEGSSESRLDYPRMDLASLESLLRSLNSADDGEVLAATELLAEKSRVDLIPALILYHPSPPVVIRTLTLFAEAGRNDVLPLLERLYGHEDAEVRAAALRALFWLSPDPVQTVAMERDPSPIVRAASWVGQVSFLGSEAARTTLEREAKEGSEEVKLAIARAIRFSPSPLFEQVLVDLAVSSSHPVRRAVARAMREIRSTAHVPSLLAMLPHRDLRHEARRTLVAIGPDALGALQAALANRWLDPQVRKHVPRSIHRFGNQRAVDVLLDQLGREPDPVVEHKILRALGRLSQERPELVYDEERLRAVIRDKLLTAYRYLDFQVQTQDAASVDPRRATASHELLVSLLAHRHRLAVEHVFRLLGVLHRELGEDFRDIYRGSESAGSEKRAGARELLEDILVPPVREPLLLLLDDIGPWAKLARASWFYERFQGTYEELLAALLAIEETGVRCIVAYHIGEQGLARLVPLLEALPSDREGLVARSVELALERVGATV